jgi:integrase
MSRDHGQGTIIQRGPRTWLLRLSYGTDAETGKRVREAVTVHGTRREADKKLRQLLGAKDAQEHPTRARGRLTVGAWMTTWLDDHPMAETTRERAKQCWKLYASDRLRARPLRNVTPAFVRAELKALQDTVSKRTKEPLAPRTIGYFHGILRNGLELARSDGFLKSNPAAHLKRPEAERKGRGHRAMTLTQATAFLKTAESDDLAALWRLLLEAGLRPAEALGLRWEDVDLAGQAFVVRQTLRRVAKTWAFGPPKDHQQRPIDLTPRAVDLLKAHRARQNEGRLALLPGRWQENDLVFCDAIGRPLAPWVVTKRYKALLKAADLPALRLYDMRHSCATLLLESGEPTASVSGLLGHARQSTTLDFYSHLSKKSQRDVATRMSKLLG